MDAYIRMRILAPMGKFDMDSAKMDHSKSKGRWRRRKESWMEKKGRMDDGEEEVKGLEKRKVNVGRKATSEAKGRGRKEGKEE